MSVWRRSVIVTGLVGLAVLPLAGQQTPRPKSPSKTETAKTGSMSAADSQFMHEAAAGGMAEVELGRKCDRVMAQVPET